jgi:hypothetical protein
LFSDLDAACRMRWQPPGFLMPLAMAVFTVKGLVKTRVFQYDIFSMTFQYDITTAKPGPLNVLANQLFNPFLGELGVKYRVLCMQASVLPLELCSSPFVLILCFRYVSIILPRLVWNSQSSCLCPPRGAGITGMSHCA